MGATVGEAAADALGEAPPRKAMGVARTGEAKVEVAWAEEKGEEGTSEAAAAALEAARATRACSRRQSSGGCSSKPLCA